MIDLYLEKKRHSKRLFAIKNKNITMYTQI